MSCPNCTCKDCDPNPVYVEFCQLCYRLDCHKPNYGGPESHSRTVARADRVEVVDGRVMRFIR